MKIEDDGKGFSVERKLRGPSRSFGIRAMQDRIELLGGAIQFGPHPSWRRAARLGTTIELRLPLDGTEAT